MNQNGVGEQVHIFTTSDCNLNCRYCFGPDTNYEERSLIEIGEQLRGKGVKHFIAGGGEPLLVRELDDMLAVLKGTGAYVEVHTNATLLDKKRVSQLSKVADCVAIPLDSLERKIQLDLRGKGFEKTFKRIFDTAQYVNDSGMDLGWHTVFASQNAQGLPQMYEKISQHPFKYWRIYEINEGLAEWKWLSKWKGIRTDKVLKKVTEKIEDLKSLSEEGTPEKGYTDSTFAAFILAEELMKRKVKDMKINFVPFWKEHKNPYVFVEPDGEVKFYTYYSSKERERAGNIFTDDWKKMMENIDLMNFRPYEVSDERIIMWRESYDNLPLWARAWEGNYFVEEFEEIEEEFWPAFNELMKIWARKMIISQGPEGMSPRKVRKDLNEFMNLWA